MRKLVPLLFLLPVMACHFSMNKEVSGNGTLKSEDRKIPHFSRIEVAGEMEVTVEQGSNIEVKVETDANLLQYIKTHVEDDELEIYVADGIDIAETHHVKVHVVAPSLHGLSVSGSGNIQVPRELSGDGSLDLGVGGSGNITAIINYPKVDAGIGGSGTITVSGKTRDLHMSIGGSGDFMGDKLLSENCKVEIGGSGNAFVYASQSLNASVGGSGTVRYSGSPANLVKNIGGSGEVEPQ